MRSEACEVSQNDIHGYGLWTGIGRESKAIISRCMTMFRRDGKELLVRSSQDKRNFLDR